MKIYKFCVVLFVVLAGIAMTSGVCLGSCSSAPNLDSGVLSGGTFSFQLTSGQASSSWGVYQSGDLVHWRFLGNVALDIHGNGSYSDTTVTGVQHRFYRLSQGNGSCCSGVVGFVNQTLASGVYYLIGNPLSNGGNQAQYVLPGLQGGETLITWGGSRYYNYNFEGTGVGTGLGYQSDWIDASAAPPTPPTIPGDQTDTSDDVYWAPQPVLPPGTGFYIYNPNPTEINTFAGQASIGNSVSIPMGVYSLRCSTVPVGGDPETGPGLNLTGNFQGGEIISIWTGITTYQYQFQGVNVGTGLGYQSDWTDASAVPPAPPVIPGDQTDTSDDVYWAPPFKLGMNQAFWIINPNSGESWDQALDVCPFP